jgi:hypothetical protein
MVSTQVPWVEKPAIPILVRRSRWKSSPSHDCTVASLSTADRQLQQRPRGSAWFWIEPAFALLHLCRYHWQAPPGPLVAPLVNSRIDQCHPVPQALVLLNTHAGKLRAALAYEAVGPACHEALTAERRLSP